MTAVWRRGMCRVWTRREEEPAHVEADDNASRQFLFLDLKVAGMIVKDFVQLCKS